MLIPDIFTIRIGSSKDTEIDLYDLSHFIIYDHLAEFLCYIVVRITNIVSTEKPVSFNWANILLWITEIKLDIDVLFSSGNAKIRHRSNCHSDIPRLSREVTIIDD